MAHVIVCASCQTRYQVKDELAGKKFKCKKCGQVVQAPGVAATAQAGSRPGAPGQPAAAQAKAVPPQAKPAAAAGKAAAPQAKPGTLAAKPAPDPSRAGAVASLLGEEPAAAGAPPEVIVASLAAETPTSGPAIPAGARAKRKCPHCGAKVDADVVYCTECGLSVHKKYSGVDRDEDRSESKLWLFVLAGIGGAMLTTPLLFLLIAVMAGGVIAMFVCVIEMYLIVAIGSFALACRIFKQEPPEPGDILRIVGWSVVPANMAVSYFGGTGPLSLLAGVGVAIVVSALLCMFQIQMPVVASILVSICYNIFAGILTVVGVIVLGVIFAGYLVTTTGKIAPEEGQGTEQMDPFAVPGGPAVPRAPGGPTGPGDDDESSLDKPREGLGPLWARVQQGDSRWFETLAKSTSPSGQRLRVRSRGDERPDHNTIRNAVARSWRMQWQT